MMAKLSYKLPKYDWEKLEPLGEFLRQLRKPVFNSAVEVAEAIGRARTTVQRWEKGISVPEDPRGYMAYLAQEQIERYEVDYYEEYQRDLSKDLLDEVNCVIVENEKLVEKKIEVFKNQDELSDEADAFIAEGAGYKNLNISPQADQGSLPSLPLHDASQDKALTPHVPLQIPPCVPYFTGREEEIEQIITDLQPGHVVTLCGSGGIGKSAITSEVVSRLTPDNDPTERFPDGIIYYQFYEQGSIDLPLEHIARSFDKDPLPTAETAARRALVDRKVLLVIDRADQAYNLEKLLSVGGDCGVLINSRSREDVLDPLFQHNITSLPIDQATKLLMDWAKIQFVDSNTIEKICIAVGNVPLAIRLVGNQLNGASNEEVDEYQQWLEKRVLSALDQGTDEHKSFTVLLKRSTYKLSETTKHVLAVIGRLSPAPFSREVVAAALKVSNYAILPALYELINHSLLERSGERYQCPHIIIHTYAKEMALPNETINSLANYYTALAEKETKLEETEYQTLDLERTHIMSILNICSQLKYWEGVQLLAHAIHPYLAIRFFWINWMEVCNAGLKASQELSIPKDEGLWLYSLGACYASLGQFEKGAELIDQGISILRKNNEQEMARNGLLEQMGFHVSRHKWENATNYMSQALEISREIGDSRAEFEDLFKMGTLCSMQKQHQPAMMYFQQALELNVEHEDEELSWMKSYIELETAYSLREEMPNSTYKQKIIDLYKKGRIIFKDRKPERFMNFNIIGDSFFNMGELELASDLYKESLQFYREQGSHRGEILARRSLGAVNFALDEYETAINYFEDALNISRSIDSHYDERNILIDLGFSYIDHGQIKHGLTFIKRAIEITLQFHLYDDEVSGLVGLYYALNDFIKNLLPNNSDLTELLIEYCTQVVKITHEMNDHHHEILFLIHLGALHNKLGEMKSALNDYQNALHIATDINNNEFQTYLLFSLGNLFSEMGNTGQAIEYYKQALIVDPNDALSHNNLAGEYLELQQFETAIEHFQKRVELSPEDALSAHVGLGIINFYQEKNKEARKHFQSALDVWDEANINKIQSPFGLLENKAVALLGVGQVEEAIDTLKEALNQRSAGDSIDFTGYDILTAAPNQLEGLADLRNMLETAMEK